jgi:Ni,Fe-hydrogenase III small subunit
VAMIIQFMTPVPTKSPEEAESVHATAPRVPVVVLVGVARTWGGTGLWYGDHGRVDCFLTSTDTRLAAGTPPRPRSVLSSLAGTHERAQS